MNETDNIERLEAAVRKLLATVDTLRRQNRDLLARLHDADSGRKELEAGIERLQAERSDLLGRVERLIADIDEYTASAQEDTEEEAESGPAQGTLGLSS
jgi:uncharacterized coiled-coil DUF342 family protein